MIILPGIDWYFGYEIAFPACMALEKYYYI